MMGRFRMIVGLVVLCCAATASAQEPPRRPNVVIIISDDHAWTDYSFMGHPTIRTPHLDRLAAQSLTFRRGYVPSSLCCPSLASIVTGQYPHAHKVTSNDPPMPAGMRAADFQKSPAFADGRERMNRFMDAAPALPRLLAKEGYVSFQAGKWWQGDFSRGGFTHGMTKGKRHGDDGLRIGRETMQPVYDFIDTAKKGGKPFLVWYAPMMPHDPHTPPERLLAKYREKTQSIHVARYWAMVEWFDETCGELLAHLDEQGLAQNTIVVYVTDNGWIQNPENPRFAPRSKQSQHDGGVRTPIMVRWPGRVAARMVDTPVSSIDLAPTLLKACAIAVPKEMSGVDLLDETAVAGRGPVFGECFTHNAVDLDDPASSLRWRYVVDGRWKLIVPHPRNEPNGVVELYDLQADEAEARNLAAADPDRVLGLRARIDAWWKP
jgi:arylsulfatase A-like enzyme